MEAKKMKHNLFNLQMFAVSSKDYWENREKEALKAYQKQEEEYDKEIERIYRDMLDAIQKEIDAFYTKYAKKEGITLAEVKKRVSKLDIEAYERKAKRYVKEAAADRRANGGQTDFTGSYFSEQANEEMMLYNLTMKVNRLEMLKANIGLELIKGHNELENFMGEILQGRTMEELERQAGILGRTIKDNAKLAHTIPNASFHNATFSDRIWQYQSLMKADLSKTLQTALIQGKNPRAVASEVRKHLVGDKYGKGARGNIERLMRTELARVQTEAQKKSIEEAGFEMYMFICNEDGRTCDICQKAASKDSGHGKGIYLIKDMMPGTNAAPLHPNCRCSTAPHEDSKDYEACLEHLEKGGTTEQWNKMKYSSKTKKVVEKSSKNNIIKLQADINKMITPYERRVLDSVPKKEGYFDFAAHGLPNSIEYGERKREMSAREVARIIRHNEHYNGQKVRLLSCNTGSIDDGFAQQLANALGVEVEAPTDFLLVYPDGRMKVGYDGSGKMKTFKPKGR